LRINHIPLAVKDLDAAAEDYRRLGFAIKPGRLHADGIRNQHIKFPADGAGIELITATEATDSLTAHYMRLIAQGEGPAYVCLLTQDLDALKAHMTRQDEAFSVSDGQLLPQAAALDWLFFAAGDNLSPTDRPEHFAHANTAYRMRAVWIAGGDQARMRRFFIHLGARIVRERRHVPDPVSAEVAKLDGGEVVFLPGSRQLLPGRVIIGVSMGVRDLTAARRALDLNGIEPVARPDLNHPGLLVAPRDTHNVWLELVGPPVG
jgi:catechol 2,3-dioxygenase-like lactoylglutathione lyase family enzyme